VKNCRTDQTKRKIGELKVDELEAAEKVWWLVVQEECFANDRKSFKIGLKFSALKGLNMSALRRAYIIKQANYQGLEAVINQLREKFWIIRCRSVVKRQFANCMYFRKYKAKPSQPMMSQLPAARFISQQKPFASTGVDLFGPLFICLTIRAIHLKVTHDLSTSSCIMGIRRMIARRGEIRDLFFDNRTNLRGADREMTEAIQKLDNNTLQHYLANRRMQWHFIPPAAPHGFW
jgi:hypothetical protein